MEETLSHCPENEWPPAYARAVKIIRDVINASRPAGEMFLHAIMLAEDNPLIEHPTIVVTQEETGCELTFFGILNGVLGNTEFRVAGVLTSPTGRLIDATVLRVSRQTSCFPKPAQ